MVDVERRNELVTAHGSFVRRVVLRTIKTFRLPAEHRDDYESAGFVGLIEAAERYDPASPIPFERFAYLRVRGAIIDHIRKQSELSGQAYRYAKVLQAVEDIEGEAMVLASVEKYPKKALARIFSFAAQGAIAFRLSPKESEAALSEALDEAYSAEHQMLAHEQARSMKRLVSELPEKERFIIEGYYYREKSFSDLIGERPDLSRSWISRLHSRALERLGKKMTEQPA